MRYATAVIGVVALGTALATARLATAAEPERGRPAPPAAAVKPAWKTHFFRMCDLAAAELQKPTTPFVDRRDASTTTHHLPFFEDAHAVRALGVAYDMTGNPRYLDACIRWADRMIDYQGRMIPAGAYYMNYNRAPGHDKGDWNVADSGSIGMGVLATAVRCAGRDPPHYDRFLASVKSFAKLVMDNYLGPRGGITNGCWSGYAGPWWCSSATAGSLLLLLHEETGEARCLQAGCGAMEWMAHQDFYQVKPVTFRQRPSGVVFYCFELYALGLRHIEPGTESHRLAMAQLDEAVRWMTAHPIRQAASARHDAFDLEVDMAGLPYLKYLFARQFPERCRLAPVADEELDRIASWLFAPGEPPVSGAITWGAMTWGMLSYAERLAPGMLFRKSK